MIEVQDLTKKYGELTAVKNLSFKVDKGKIWGFLGPNAAGKTTTMRILTGYLPATDGRAYVAGLDIFEKTNEVKKIVGYLPENPPLYPDLTVQAFLNFVAEIKKVPPSRRKEAVDMVIEQTKLEKVAGRLIRNISRGFKQRVGIAQALIHDPQVIVLDEPTIGLDPEHVIEIRSLIKSMRGHRTIILSTHILYEVTQVCDGVVIINDGQLKASGSLEELSASLREKDGVILKFRHDDGMPKAVDNFIIESFRQIQGITSLEVHGPELWLVWPRGQFLSMEVLKVSLAKGLIIEEMKPLGMNIEDLYIKIISGGIQ